MLEDKNDKMRREVTPIMVDGKPVYQLIGMIYWFSWGDHVFDIRSMREVLGLKTEYKIDTDFSNSHRVCKMISKLLDVKGDSNFKDLMKSHDNLISAEQHIDTAEPIDCSDDDDIPF